MYYLDWAPEGPSWSACPVSGAPTATWTPIPLARERLGSTADYLRDRLSGLLRLVPAPRDLYIRLRTAERMVADGLGLDTLKTMIHDLGASFDLWTLDAGTPRWEERLRLAIDLGRGRHHHQHAARPVPGYALTSDDEATTLNTRRGCSEKNSHRLQYLCHS